MAAARPRWCGSRSASSRRTRGRRRCSAGRPPPGRGGRSRVWRVSCPSGKTISSRSASATQSCSAATPACRCGARSVPRTERRSSGRWSGATPSGWPTAGCGRCRRGVPAGARGARARPGAAPARAGRADRRSRLAPRDGPVRAGARARRRAGPRRHHDHASRQPGRPLRRSRAAARRRPSRGRRPAGRRPDARDRGARVRLACRDRGLRRPPPDDPAAQRKRTMRLRTGLLLCSLAPAALPAQEPTDTVTLRPVVVTATRVPTPADAVTAAVTVISGADLRAQGIRTVLDALRGVPAAAVVQTGSFGGVTSLFLRGGQSKYVKVLVDGVPVNEPGGAFDFAHLTTDNVERIEVLRGPASVLYGSDAVTGVVQIFT